MVLNPVRFYSNYDKVTTDNAKIMHISFKCLSLELYCFQMVELLLTSRYMNKEQNLNNSVKDVVNKLMRKRGT